MKVLRSKELREIDENLKKTYKTRFNIKKFAVFITGSENKIWVVNREAFNPDFGKINVATLGCYFGRFDGGKLRLSIEGAQMVGKTSLKNICETSDVQEFIKGNETLPENCINCEEKEYVIIKNQRDILGVARFEEGKLKNVLPKSRKINPSKRQ